MILAKSKSHWCINKIEIKIPQLTLGELAQMDRHWDENTKVLVGVAGSISHMRQTFLLKLIYPSVRKQYKNDNIVNFV